MFELGKFWFLFSKLLGAGKGGREEKVRQGLLSRFVGRANVLGVLG